MLHRSILPAFSRRSLGRRLRRCSISGAASNTTASAFGHLFFFTLITICFHISTQTFEKYFFSDILHYKTEAAGQYLFTDKQFLYRQHCPMHRTRFVFHTNLEAPYYAGTHLMVSLIILFFPMHFTSFVPCTKLRLPDNICSQISNSFTNSTDQYTEPDLCSTQIWRHRTMQVHI